MKLISNGKTYVDNSVDIKDKVITFDSGDELNPESPVEIPELKSGSFVKDFAHGVSLAFRNIRYLFRLLGTTDISKIGDGTVTGAIGAVAGEMANVTVFAYTNIDNGYVQSFGLSLWKMHSTYFAMVQFSLKENLSSWASVDVAKVNDWTGASGTIPVISLSGSTASLMCGIYGDGTVRLSTHGSVIGNAWFYGNGMFL